MSASRMFLGLPVELSGFFVPLKANLGSLDGAETVNAPPIVRVD
jgi:hypothetical protein